MKIVTYKLLNEDIADVLIKTDQKVSDIQKSFKSIGGSPYYDNPIKTVTDDFKPFKSGKYNVKIILENGKTGKQFIIDGIYSIQWANNQGSFRIYSANKSFSITTKLPITKEKIIKNIPIPVGNLNVISDDKIGKYKDFGTLIFKKLEAI